MRKYLLLFALFFINYTCISQIAPSKYLIQFTDKNNSSYSIDNPSEYLSQKAIYRREKQGINIRQNDLPVNTEYIDSIKNTGVTILNKSKWFNAVTIYTTDSIALEKINSFSFVLKISKFQKIINKTKEKYYTKKFPADFKIINTTKKNLLNKNDKTIGANQAYNYGYSYNQINMIAGNYIHNFGYKGEGMTIAILDAGFWHVDSLHAFDSLWKNNQILGVHDFVEQNGNVFDKHYHGMMVLSLMGGNYPYKIIGTAPKANFWLLRSEDSNSEYIIEEDNWVAAAEFADSAGADIINSSLGYTIFDDSLQNHTYADMNGNTTRITTGADIAASKGIIVVNSAGNSGDSQWKYIGAPADGDSVLTVGGVDSNGIYADFSSTGPTYDGRIKPNIVAQAKETIIASPLGDILAGNGTSLSSPIIAGMTACLWQAHPDLTNMQIINAIEKSSSQYNNPNFLMGYGIPNFALANMILSGFNIDNFDFQNSADIFPNPFINTIYIVIYSEYTQTINIELYDIIGKKIYTEEKLLKINGYNYMSINNLEHLSKGIYFLKLSSDNKTIIKKLLKVGYKN